MIADLLTALFAVHLPLHPALRIGLVGIALALFICCLCAAHAPERRQDRGGFQ